MQSCYPTVPNNRVAKFNVCQPLMAHDLQVSTTVTRKARLWSQNKGGQGEGGGRKQHLPENGESASVVSEEEEGWSVLVLHVVPSDRV